jgi:hypothetical protein
MASTTFEQFLDALNSTTILWERGIRLIFFGIVRMQCNESGALRHLAGGNTVYPKGRAHI